MENLPALESLQVEIHETAGPLASPSLQQLSVEGVCAFTMHSYPSLGSLPRLRSLHIKLLPSLAVSSDARFLLCCLPSFILPA